jgi:hypothetical protein
LEKKYRGAPTPRWRAALRVLKRTAQFLLTVPRNDTRQFAWLKFQAGFFDALGQFTR